MRYISEQIKPVLDKLFGDNGEEYVLVVLNRKENKGSMISNTPDVQLIKQLLAWGLAASGVDEKGEKILLG